MSKARGCSAATGAATIEMFFHARQSGRVERPRNEKGEHRFLETFTVPHNGIIQ